MIYQIKDWDEHFENNRSRQVDKCNFICIPNKQSGMGLTRILAEKDGLAIYGAWHLITGACSQQHPPRDGWLTDTGKPDGLPWTEDDLAIKFRRDAKDFKRALDILTAPKVGWIIVHDVKEGDLITTPAPVKKERTVMAKPTVDQVQDRMLAVGFPREICQSKAEEFVAYYETRGWRLKGGTPMAKWESAVTTWKKNQDNGNGSPRTAPRKETEEEEMARALREAQE